MNTRKPKTHIDPKTGEHWVRMSHPCIPDRDVTLRAPSAQVLALRVAWLGRLKEDLRFGLRTREEVIALIKAPLGLERDPPVREVLDAYEASLEDKIGSLRQCQTARAGQLEELERKRPSELNAECMAAWERRMLVKPWTRGKDEQGNPRVIVGYSANTILIAYGVLSRALAAKGLTRAWGKWRPRNGRRAKRREKARDITELVRLLEAACDRDVRTALRGRLADLTVRVLVLALCGARKGEGTALAWSDYARSRQVLTITYGTIDGWKERHPEWPRALDLTKNRDEHDQLVHPAVALALDWQASELAARGWYRPDGPIFPSDDGSFRPNSRLVSNEKWRPLVVAAELPNPRDWVVHSLRHTMSSLEAEAGSPMRDIAARGGWKSLEVLEDYVRLPGRGLVPSRVGLPEPPPPRPHVDLVELVRGLLARISEAAEAGRARRGPRILEPGGARAKEERERARAKEEAEERRQLRDELGHLSLGELARTLGVDDVSRAEAERRARRAYHGAYQAALRDTGRHEEARRKANEAAERVRRSWARACQRAAKKRDSQPPTEGDEPCRRTG